MQLNFAKTKLKIYKTYLYIGDRRVLLLTFDGLKKFVAKMIWIIAAIVIIFSMIFGGILLLGGGTTDTIQLIQP